MPTQDPGVVPQGRVQCAVGEELMKPTRPNGKCIAAQITATPQHMAVGGSVLHADDPGKRIPINVLLRPDAAFT